MKIVAYILSFYLLFLAAVPCCAFDTCKEKAVNERNNDAEKNNDCKNCSPFATCGNCMGFTIATESFRADIIKPLAERVFSDPVQGYFPQYICSFWQPPRLG